MTHGDRATLRLFEGLARCESRGVTAPLGVDASGGAFLCAVHVAYLLGIYF